MKPEGRCTGLYLRSSTQDQNLESQQRALLDWCSKQGIFNYELFSDHGISGAKESRPALNQLMGRVERGEIEQVIVFSFSRFARSVSHLLRALEKFREKGTRFLSITESLDTNSPMGMALFTILGALAELERELIRERVVAGLKNARAKGKLIGRKNVRDSDLIRKLIKSGLTYRAVSSIAACSHGSVSAEVALMKKEERELKSKQAEQEKTEKELQENGEILSVIPDPTINEN